MNAVGAKAADWDKCFRVMADIDLSGFDGKQTSPARYRPPGVGSFLILPILPISKYVVSTIDAAVIRLG